MNSELKDKYHSKNKARHAITLAVLFGLVQPVYASPPVRGQLVIINGLANIVNGSTGNTASTITIAVSDTTGVCSTTTSVLYGGVATVQWDATKTHSATQCISISSVNISALKTASGLVQYDATANSTPPTVATAATTFTAPTTVITNLSLIITGDATPASAVAATGTVWGVGAASTPVYDATNGELVTTGVMSGVGAEGLRAIEVMRNHAIAPH
ncbi:MAG: hypothetical protein ACHP65_00595 [Legionellales bacterium]